MIAREREARRLRVLVGRLREDREILDRVHEKVRESESRVVRDDPDPILVAAAALFLQHFYTSVEDILSRIALDLEGSLPAGEGWHRELVDQMTREVPGVRPSVLDRSSRKDLDEMRRFRHRVRHAYSAEYEWEEMQRVLEAESRVHGDISRALDRFEGFLEKTIEALEGA